MNPSHLFSSLRRSVAKSPINLVCQVTRFSVGAIVAIGIALVGVSAATPAASAQAVTYAGTGAVNFGTANVCPSGKTTPAPCTQTMTLTYKVTASGTLGTPKALTTGAPNLDYKLASGSTCSGSVIQGNSCTVKVTFAPIAPGGRNGAVEIVNAGGGVLATTYIYGNGVGPLVGFNPQPQVVLPNDLLPSGVAVDASGNVFVTHNADTSYLNEIDELLAVNGSLPANPVVKTIGTASFTPAAIALDGAGNLFFETSYSYPQKVVEILAEGGYTTIKAVVSGLSDSEYLTDIAVDGSGNLFVADNVDSSFDPGAVTEYLAADGYATGKVLGGGFSFYAPVALALDGSGNLFVADMTNAKNISPPGTVEEILAAGGYTTVRTISVASSAYESPSSVAVNPSGDLFVGFVTTIGEFFAVDGVVPANPTPVNIGNPGGYLLTKMASDGRGNIFAIGNSCGDCSFPPDTVLELQMATAPPLAFASTEVGHTSSDSPQTIQIQNQGTANLDITDLSVSKNWDIVPGSGTPADCMASSAVAASAPCNLSISFDPVEAGSLTGTFEVVDNSLSVSGSTQSSKLTGTATSVAPHIASLNQTYASPYSVVILYGTNFGATQGSSTVTFGGIATPHYSWSDTKIYVTVPPNATTGNLVVTVNGQASNPVAFTVLPQAAVTGISPTSGPVGTVVTISGKNLVDYENKGTVTFDGESLPILSETSTAIQVAIPTGAVSGYFHILINDTGINTPTFTVTK
jgi:hypothetical protein